jgi:predicted transcriptional regulator
MAEIDWSSTGRDADERADRRADMARALARGGMDGVQVLSFESAEKVLTPKRRELIEAIRTEDVESVRQLARLVDRDKGQVSRDLGVLADHGVIQYEDTGRAKRPYLVQEHITVEPV